MNAEIKSEINALVAKTGSITPDDVVAFAKRNKSSATRKWLDKKGAFDPKVAMKEHAKTLARQIIRSIKIVVPDGAGEHTEIRGLVSVADDRLGGTGYRPFGNIIGDEDAMNRYMETCRKEMLVLVKRYRMLERISPFSSVFEAMKNAAG